MKWHFLSSIVSMEDIKQWFFFCFAIAGFYIFTRLAGRKRRHFLENGIQSTAKVMGVEKTSIEIGSGVGAQPVMKIKLKVVYIGNPEVTTEQAFNVSDIPEVGDLVCVLIDPKNSEKVMIYPDQKSSYN